MGSITGRKEDAKGKSLGIREEEQALVGTWQFDR
jgi:hypothetical protein